MGESFPFFYFIGLYFQLWCANAFSCLALQVTYFKKYRIADYQKKKTFERLEKEGANKMAVGQGPGDASASAGR